MRTLLAGSAIAALVAALAACGSSGMSAAAAADRKAANILAIDQIERSWHQAASKKDLDLMMSLWAPNATFTFGGQTASGRAAIRKVLKAAAPFQPQNHWVSDTPAYKIRTTVNGSKGTLYFECHYIDVKTQKVMSVVAADQNVQKINGKWLITNSSGASPTLSP